MPNYHTKHLNPSKVNVLGIKTIYETQSINHTINPQDTDLRGSTRLPTSTGDSRRLLLLKIPIRAQALTVSLALSQFFRHYNSLTTQYKYIKH